MDCRMDVCREGRMDGGMGGWIEIGWIGDGLLRNE